MNRYNFHCRPTLQHRRRKQCVRALVVSQESLNSYHSAEHTANPVPQTWTNQLKPETHRPTIDEIGLIE